MYLAQLRLNSQSREVHRDLGDAHKLHQRIMQAFPDENRENARADWNVLFRQEPEHDVVLVSSTIEADWTLLPSGYLLGHMSKPFEVENVAFITGQLLQFRLKANPSKRDNQSRKLIGMFHEADQLEWLRRQGDRNGFVLKEVDVIQTPNIFGIKESGKSSIRLKTVLFQGVLAVENIEQFKIALQQGIGRGRSYGCGLLSVAKFQG
jgi:CRISPR system Cascade subunit CasE